MTLNKFHLVTFTVFCYYSILLFVIGDPLLGSNNIKYL